MSECLHDKFRGCLLGALLGDCLGYPFELHPAAHQRKIDNFFSKYGDPQQEVSLLHYSDDTAMTRTLGWSLVKNDGVLIPRDVAVNFAKDFFRPQPERLYGAAVGAVFSRLKADSSDPFKPAQMQFNGSGSFGNGGAMRVAPVALLYHENVDQLKANVRDCTRITHAHRDGINGATLQALAIMQALHTNSDVTINTSEFLAGLIDAMMKLEQPAISRVKTRPLYVSLLQEADKFLQQGKSVDAEQVVDTLGNGETAPTSVVTAIYCFLRATLQDSGIKGETTVVRAIRCAIELGGDTDTIGTMAGAIAGAFCGEKSVPAVLLRHCEELDDVSRLADELFQISQRKALKK